MAVSVKDRVQAEERLNDIFQPDIVLPTQFFGALQRKRYPSGEHRLLVAIIRDAVDCFQKHIHARDGKRRQLFVDAEEWINIEGDRSPFSFVNVCDMLGMNPDFVREGLVDGRDDERERSRRSRRRQQPVLQLEEPQTEARVAVGL